MTPPPPPPLPGVPSSPLAPTVAGARWVGVKAKEREEERLKYKSIHTIVHLIEERGAALKDKRFPENEIKVERPDRCRHRAGAGNVMFSWRDEDIAALP